MRSLLRLLQGKKTYLVVAVGLVNLYLARHNHQIDTAQAIDEAMKLLGLATVRAGIATATTPKIDGSTKAVDQGK